HAVGSDAEAIDVAGHVDAEDLAEPIETLELLGQALPKAIEERRVEERVDLHQTGAGAGLQDERRHRIVLRGLLRRGRGRQRGRRRRADRKRAAPSRLVRHGKLRNAGEGGLASFLHAARRPPQPRDRKREQHQRDGHQPQIALALHDSILRAAIRARMNSAAAMAAVSTKGAARGVSPPPSRPACSARGASLGSTAAASDSALKPARARKPTIAAAMKSRNPTPPAATPVRTTYVIASVAA